MIFKFVTFAVFPVYAHLFSVERFGVLALVSSSAALISTVLNLGLNNAVVRYYLAPDVLQERRSVVLLLWSSLVTALLLFGLRPFSDALEQRYGIEWPLLVLALAANLPLLVIMYCLDVIRVHFSPWRYSLLAAVRSLPAIAISLFLVIALDQELVGYFAGQVLAFALAVPFGLWLVRKELKWRFDFGLAREIVLYGYPFIFTGLAYWMFNSMDRWMLGELSDNTNVGLYSIAYNFAGILIFVTTAFAQAWSPFAIFFTSSKVATLSKATTA